MNMLIAIPFTLLMVEGLLTGGFSQAETLKVDTTPIVYEAKIDSEFSYTTNRRTAALDRFLEVKVEVTPTPEELFLKYFPEEDYEETTTVLSKVLHGEAEGVTSDTNRAAVIWCILNRVDADHRGETPIECAKARKQFAYNRRYTPREDEVELIQDVLYRWLLEKEGQEDVGRVLPSEYLYFIGNGEYNCFRQTIDSEFFIPIHSEVYGD